MIEIIGIDNPRTPEGSWVDELGCAFCGSISSAYAGIRIDIHGEMLTLKICKGCLNEGEKKINKLLLEQCKHRVG